MNKITVLVSVCLLFHVFANLKAQPIPLDYSWPDFASLTGYNGDRPGIRKCYPFLDLIDSLGLPTLELDGETMVIDQQLQDALKAISHATPNPDTLDVIYFPEGKFRITNMVVLSSPNVVIKGAGAGKTIFEWTGIQQYCFNAIGKDSLAAGGVPVNGNEQDYSFTMPERVLDFEPGDWAVLTRNDPGKGCDTTFLRQFVKVDQVANQEVFFENALRISYRAEEDAARVHKLVPLMNIGFEDFTLDASNNNYELRAGSMHSSIVFQFAVSGWVRGVESIKAAYQHVIVNKASNIEVFGCYFHDSQEFSGGRGYGVNLQNGAAECRIENNIFATLRHAIVIQRGANGNAVAYNYCTDSQDGNGEDDLIFHGGHPFRNLAEGNSVEHLHFDLRQCNNGPYNIVFRNQVRKKNVQAGTWPLGAGEYFCVVGNESEQCISLVGNPHESWDNIEYGTWCGGKHGDDGVAIEIGNSLLYDAQPDYLRGTSWPVFGPGKSFYGKIPAETRYLSDIPNTVSSYLYTCAPPQPLEVGFENQPCQTLNGTGTQLAGRIQLKIEGGVPPYDISWDGIDAPEHAQSALYYGSGYWMATISDQTGSQVTVMGHLENCQLQDSIALERYDTQSYIRPIDLVAYPNPTHNITYLKINLYQAALVKVDIYNSKGQRVWALPTPHILPEGENGFKIDASNWSPGIYSIRVKVADQYQFKKLMIMDEG